MPATHSVKFRTTALNVRLRAEMRAADMTFTLGDGGRVCYAADDEERVEDGPLQRVRDAVFASWQILSCPPDWADRYRAYMTAHRVPFEEQWADNELTFLLPRQYRPHQWRLPGDRPRKRTRVPANAGS